MMPQVVGCNQCRQQFLAEDHLAATIVGCPSCGAALAIPAVHQRAAAPAQAMAQAAGAVAAPFHPSAPGASFGELVDRLAKHLPPQYRRRDRAIGLAVVAAAGALWLLIVLPSVPFLLTGFNAPVYGQIAGRIGGLSALFWIAIFVASGGLFEWSFFMDSYKMQITRQWFGDQGARWFLAGIGGLLAFVALAMLGIPQVIGMVNRARFAVAGPLVPRGQQPPPSPPPALDRDRQTALPPLVKSAPSGQAGSAPATVQTSMSAPAPARPSTENLEARDDKNLPGQWRRLEGGFALKLPESTSIVEDSLKRRSQRIEHLVAGRTKEGKDGVVFSVLVEHDPNEDFLDVAQRVRDIRSGRVRSADPGGDVTAVNGLALHRSERSGDATEGYNAEFFVHRSIRHQYAGEGIRITIDVRSRFPVDHPDVLALVPYVHTLQAIDLGDPPAGAAVDEGTWQGTWRYLPGGLCVLIPDALRIEEDAFRRTLGAQGQTEQVINGATDDGAEFRLVAKHIPHWNVQNRARSLPEFRDENFQMESVKINGLLFTRTTRLVGDRTDVDYEYREGPSELTLRIKASRGRDDPSLAGLVAYAETMQRAPK